MQSPYRPYLIHRVDCHYDPSRSGLGVLCDYDYMGAAEFEHGAVGRSNAATRLAILENNLFRIVKVPLQQAVTNKITNAEYREVYALINDRVFSSIGADNFFATVQRLVHDKEDTKEHCYFNKSFSMWHDIEHQIYYSFNAVFLRLIYSILARPDDYAKTISTQLSMGDDITIAKVLNGKAIHSVDRMEEKTGTVAGILESDVTVKSHGKKYRMPFDYILTHDVEIHAPYEVSV